MSQDVECHGRNVNAPVTCPKVIVALGGNVASHVGSPELTLRSALTRLADSALQVVSISKFYATPCFPAGSGPDYVNAAAVLSGMDDGHGILNILHQVEAEFGRARDRRWGRRTLDLDLIALGDAIRPDLETYRKWRALPLDRQMTEAPDRLILPHPRMQDRAFVLIPLAEIAPDWRHPVTGRSVAEMADALPEAEKLLVRPL